MRRLLLAFFLGAAVASSVWLALYYITPKPDAWRAIETLDFLIDEWTAERGIDIAGLPARIELPDARPRFFPDTVRKLAARIELTYQVPRAVTLAQYALESKWGTSNLGASNYFGHTFAAVERFMPVPMWVWRPERIMRGDTIVVGPAVRFAKYRNITECFDTHGKYLSQSALYRSAFKAQSPEGFARAMGKRYATDPDYSLKLIAIMRRYNLGQDHAAN